MSPLSTPLAYVPLPPTKLHRNSHHNHHLDQHESPSQLVERQQRVFVDEKEDGLLRCHPQQCGNDTFIETWDTLVTQDGPRCRHECGVHVVSCVSTLHDARSDYLRHIAAVLGFVASEPDWLDSQNNVKQHGTVRNTTEQHRLQLNTTKHHGILRSSTDHHGIARRSTEYISVSQNAAEYYETL